MRLNALGIKGRIMIKKLVIEKEKGGMRPLEPNHEEKQRITINSNGAVWFTSYGVDTTDEWKYKALRKTRAKLGIEQTNTLLGLAEELFGEMHGIIDPPICDGERDLLTVNYESGYVQKKYINEEEHPTMQRLYEELRKTVAIKNLLLFEYDFYTE